MRKFYRSNENKILAGVIGGIGEYFNVDPVILRVAWILLIVFTGFMPGIIAYLLAIFVVPKKADVIITMRLAIPGQVILVKTKKLK